MVGGATAAVRLDNPGYQLVAPGATFAGRDIFAPAAAYLCAGVPLEELGTPVDPASLLPGVVPLPREEGGALVGQVLWIDRFGNCQLNLDPDQLDGWPERVQVRWSGPQSGVRTVKLAHNFEALGRGGLGLVVDSYGLVAVAVAEGSAADLLGLAAGDEVALTPLDDEPDQPDSPDRAGTSIPVTLERKPT
jgi:S-adenosylmethionine hydrolase